MPLSLRCPRGASDWVTSRRSRRGRRSRVLALGLVGLAAFAARAVAAQEGSTPLSSPPNGALPGELDVHASDVELDPRTRELLLRGDVRVDSSPFYLRADELRVRRTARGAIDVDGDGRVAFCPCLGAPLAVRFSEATLAPPADLFLRSPRLEVFGAPVLWLPHFWLRTPDKPGLLAPDVAYRGSDGMFLGDGVHLPIHDGGEGARARSPRRRLLRRRGRGGWPTRDGDDLDARDLGSLARGWSRARRARVRRAGEDDASVGRRRDPGGARRAGDHRARRRGEAVRPRGRRDVVEGRRMDARHGLSGDRAARGDDPRRWSLWAGGDVSVGGGGRRRRGVRRGGRRGRAE